MPNHIHGILEIVDGGNGVGCGYDACRDDACIVSTTVATNPMGQMDDTDESSTNPQQSETNKMAAISPKSGSVSRVIGSYKSAVTKHAHRLGQNTPTVWDTNLNGKHDFTTILFATKMIIFVYRIISKIIPIIGIMIN